MPATPFWILKFKRVWQAQFLSHNLVTLEKWAFFKRCSNDINTIFWYLQPKIWNQQKTDFFLTQYPQIGINYTYLGMTLNKKISFLEITDFWLEISKNGINIIWTPIKNTPFFKVTRLWLKNWACHALLNFKIQKGVAGTIFELRSWNFGKMSIFSRCSNDISTIFPYSCLLPT